MKQILVFILLSIPSLYYSWRSMFSFKNHGFYRFFGWEGIIWLFSVNFFFWFNDPFSLTQILSWFLLLVSMYLAITGVFLMLKFGKQSAERDDNTLFHFEKTTGLIVNGVYKYIRHPLYGSLIFLCWGICLKQPTPANIAIAGLSTFFLYITSKYDEKECIQFFGEEYKMYMKRSKMFIPFIF